MSTVVLNWNGWRDTLSCLRALDRSSVASDVIVVDNGSTDGSEQHIRQCRPDVRVLQTGANIGYAGGNNRGIRAALADGAAFIWVLNNDARPRPGALRALLGAMHPQVGALASAGFDSFVSATLVDHQVLCTGCDQRFHDADMVLGPSLLFRSDVFREVGLFDERYFHYWEEKDLVMRAHRAGWQLGLACASLVDHHGGGALPTASPQAAYYILRNQILYEQRFYDQVILAFLWRRRRRIRSRLALRTSLRERDCRRIVAVTLAVADALRGRTGPRDLGARYHSAAREH